MFLFIFCHFHPHSLLPLSTTRWFVPLFVCLSVCTLVTTHFVLLVHPSWFFCVFPYHALACFYLRQLRFVLIPIYCFLPFILMFDFACSIVACLSALAYLFSLHTFISYVSFLVIIASILFGLFCWHCHTTSHSSTPHPMNRATYLPIWSFELDCTLWPLFYKPCCLTLFPSYLWVLK